MNVRSQTMLADYVRTLRRFRVLIVLVALICAGLGYGYSKLQTKTYRATASVDVRDPSQDLSQLGVASYGTGQTPLQIASAHVPQVTRTAVLQRVKSQLRSPDTLDQIRSLVDVVVDPNSFQVKISAESSKAAEAARIVNAFGYTDASLTTAAARRSYSDQAHRLQAKIKHLKAKDPTTAAIYTDRLSTLQFLSSVTTPARVSHAADVPASPISPKPVRNTVAAGVFGLLLGIALAYARAMFDRKLRDSGDVEQLFELPVAGHVRPQALGHAGSGSDASVRGRPLDPIDAESFRRIRENVRYLTVDEELRTIAITSAIPQEGKSTVAACLAMASAATGTPTLLVECDLRKRVLGERLGIAEVPGLSDFLVGKASPQDILQVVPTAMPEVSNGSGPSPAASATSLVCITAGSAPLRPADLLSSARFRDFIAQVRQAYGTVIVDCPPLLPVADALEIIPHVDGVLMCVRLNRTTADQARAARDALNRLPDKPAGLVVTDFTTKGTRSYRDYYYYREDLAKPGRNGDHADAETPVPSEETTS